MKSDALKTILKKKSTDAKASFMNDYSDDSGTESNLVESYSNMDIDGASHCLIDSGTTHVILTDKRFFTNIDASSAPRSVKTLGGTVSIAEGAGKAQVVLPNGTVIAIEKAIYAPKASRNLLSFSDLRKNGLYVNTATMSDKQECLRLVERTEASWKNAWIAEMGCTPRISSAIGTWS